MNQRFLEELTTVAELGGDWGYVGALRVAMNFVLDADHGDPQFLAIRALEDVVVPSVGVEPPTEDLREGESRRLAQPHAGDQANVIYARPRPDGTIAAIIDGVDQADGVHKQWEWEGLSAPDYPSFLRELGDRLITPSFWAHDDLAPYFPCRARSRAQMRAEAQTNTS